MDGYLLHSLHFRAEVKDGDSLLVESVENRPVFSSNMTASEVAEFLATSMEMGGYSQVETVYVRPASFAGRSGGFEVEFTMVDGRTGLQQRAWSAGVVEGGVLYLVEYFAERSYYFDKHIDSVRGLVASLQL